MQDSGYIILPIIENIEKYFADYLNLKSWLLWKAEPPSEKEVEKARVIGKEVKYLKRPKNPVDGTNASTSNPETWGTWSEAKATYLANPGLYDGFGLAQRGLGGVNLDLDHIFVNEKIKKNAQEIIDAVDSYTEVTPSGDGCRIYSKGTWFKGKDTVYVPGDTEEEKQKVEFFGDGNFYVTVTGHHIGDPDRKIEDRNKETKGLWDLWNPPVNRKKESEGETDSSLQEALENTGTEYRMEKDAQYQDMVGTKFKVLCPWGETHGNGINRLGDAFLFLPDGDKMPWFHCSHSGCKEDGKKGIREYYIKAFGYPFSRRNLSEEIDDLILTNEGMEFGTLWLDKELCIFSKQDKNTRSQHLKRLIKRKLINKHPTQADSFRVRVQVKKGAVIGTPTPPEIKVKLPLDLNDIIQVHAEDIVMFGGITATGKTTCGFHIVYLNYGLIPIVYMSNGEITQYQKDSRTQWFLRDHPLEYWQDRGKWDWDVVNPPAKFHEFIPLYKNTLIICDYFNCEKQYEAGMYMNEIHRSLEGTGNVAIVMTQLHEGKDEFNSKVYGGDQVVFPASTFIKLMKTRYPNENLIMLKKVRTPQPGKEDGGYSRRYRIAEAAGKLEPTTEWDNTPKVATIEEANELMLKKWKEEHK